MFFFPYTGNNNPNWLSYFSEGLNHRHRGEQENDLVFDDKDWRRETPGEKCRMEREMGLNMV